MFFSGRNDEFDEDQGLAPWADQDAIRWIGTVESWINMAILIQKTLNQEPRKYPHQIRAAASLVIMFARPNLWPAERAGILSIEDVAGLARRQLAQVKHQFSIKARIEPELKRDPTYRKLMDSLDEELRILESRVSEEEYELPEKPPGSWKEFWHEDRTTEN